MKIELYKPGASEFKRSEHYIEIVQRIISFLDDEIVKNHTKEELSRREGDNPPMILDLYLKYGILKKKPSDPKKWSDRLISLFKRTKWIEYENNTKITAGPITKLVSKIEKNYMLQPFSVFDFIQSIAVSYNITDEGESYLQRALNILISNNFKMRYEEFKLSFMYIDKVAALQECSNMLNDDEGKNLYRFLCSGSGYEDKEEKKFADDYVEKFVSILLDDDTKWEDILLLQKNAPKKWSSFTKKSILLSNDIENFRDLNLDEVLTEEQRVKLILYFDYSKKEGDYSSLIKMYVLKLPFFIMEGENIKIDDNMKEISIHFSNVEVENDDLFLEIEELYEKFVPLNLRKKVIDYSEFYPQYSLEWLKDFITDNELWVDRKRSKIEYYSLFVKNLEKNNLPTIYEFFSILYLYKLIGLESDYDKFASCINTALNSNMLPIHHAGPGVPDAVFDIGDKKLTIEPTIQIGEGQAKHEHNVIKHAENSRAEECYVVSPKTANSLLRYAQSNNYNIKLGIKLIPIDSEIIKTSREKLDDLQKNSLDKVSEF